VFRFYENENDATLEAMEILLIPVAIDNDAFEVGFKLQELYNNIRLCFHRNASLNATQRWNSSKKMPTRNPEDESIVGV
jgi:hypothetical protein